MVADSAAKPNNAVQEQQTFINENKIIAMTGSTSSAVAVALNKFAQREKILYLVAISGSNDTTGKDCARYSFRQCFYGETAANAIGPVLVKAYGKGKKAAFMTPDYTYGHTVTKSVNDYLTENGGWTMVTNQISPLGTSDFSQYLTNIANSGADAIINVNWGRDAVLSIQQAKQFGLTPKMKMVIPYQIPFLAKEVGPELTEGVYAATDFWWTLEDRFPLAKMFVAEFEQEVRLQAGMGRQQRLHAVRHLGAHGFGSRHVLPAGGHQAVREGRDLPFDCRRRAFPARRSPTRSSGYHRPRQVTEGHEKQGRLLGSPGRRPRGAAHAEARRLRLQTRRLYLTLTALSARARRRGRVQRAPCRAAQGGDRCGMAGPVEAGHNVGTRSSPTRAAT